MELVCCYDEISIEESYAVNGGGTISIKVSADTMNYAIKSAGWAAGSLLGALVGGAVGGVIGAKLGQKVGGILGGIIGGAIGGKIAQSLAGKRVSGQTFKYSAWWLPNFSRSI